MKTKRTKEEREAIQEALEILEGRMTPDNIAFLISMLPWDGVNYTDVRDEIFAGESFDDIINSIKTFTKKTEGK